MTGAWKIWQGWINAIASVLLFISPWVFRDASSMTFAATGSQAAEWTAWIGGILGFAAALWLLIRPRALWLAVASFVIGVLLFLAPWVLGFTAVTGVAWTAWVLGVIMALVAATTFVGARRAALTH